MQLPLDRYYSYNSAMCPVDRPLCEFTSLLERLFKLVDCCSDVCPEPLVYRYDASCLYEPPDTLEAYLLSG